MDFNTNFKSKGIRQNLSGFNNEFKNFRKEKMAAATIHDQIYLLAIVFTNNTDKLRDLMTKTGIKFNLNFVYKLPVQDVSNMVEELNQLVAVNGYFDDIHDFITKNELIKRLLCLYKIPKLELNEQIAVDTNRRHNQASCSSTTSPCSDSYSFGFESEPLFGYANDEMESLVAEALTNNTFFDLSLLHIAVMLDNLSMVQLLIKFGACLKPFKQNHIHPIHLALYQNNCRILGFLFDQLSDEDIREKLIDKLLDDRGYNALNIAIYNNNREALEMVYMVGADVNYDSDYVTYPLIWALENMEISYNLVELLLSMGANPNCVDKSQHYTPLMVAIISGRKDLIRLLITYGADIHAICDYHAACCALQLAIEKANVDKNFDILKILLSCGANASHYNDYRKLNDGEENNHTTNRLRSAPLLDAISMSDKDIVAILLSYGANPNTDPNGTYSPLCTACFLGSSEIVELLLRYGVDPTVNCHSANTPLTIALSMNHNKVAEMLLPYYTTKELVNKQDANGDHALLYAALNKNSTMVKKLLKAGANADLENKYHATALWYCVYNNDKESLIHLIPYVSEYHKASYGIEYNGFRHPPEIIFNVPHTPIELAETQNKFTMIYFLKFIGAKIPEKAIENLNKKIKVKIDEISHAHDSEYKEELSKQLHDLRLITDYVSKPLTLKEICRHYFRKNSLLRQDVFDIMPSTLESYLKYETL